MCKREFLPDENIKFHMIFIHGVYSDGSGFEKIYQYFDNLIDDKNINIEEWDSIDEFHRKSGNVKISSIKYGRLLLSLGRIPFVRNLITHIIVSRLQAYTYRYPNAKTMVFAHSFGTWALAESIEKFSHHFRINYVVLLGSVIKRGFDWSRFPFIQNVYNFIGKKDIVVLSSALWGTGWSGRYGFKNHSANLTEYTKDWGHTDYSKNPEQFYDLVNNIYTNVQGKMSDLNC